MTRTRVTCVAALLAALALGAPAARAQQPADRRSAEQKAIVKKIAPRPLSFEERREAAAARSTFVSRGPGYSLALSASEAVIGINRRSTGPAAANLPSAALLRMQLAGASSPNGTGVDALPGIVYHVTGGVGPLAARRTYRRVRYEQVYPGIDAIYHGDSGQLEFDFIVAPQADPSRIRLAFSGAEKISLTSAGALALRNGYEEVLLNKPVAYQDVEGVRRNVAATFVLHPDSTARIALGPYDPALPLVIDPTITFATYFGSDLDDSILALETDESGVYIFGKIPDAITTLSTPSTNFFGPSPIATTPHDCYVGKLVPSQNGALSYSWLAIFHDSQTCEAMTVAPNGEVFIARTGIDERIVIDGLSEPNGLTLNTRFPLPQLASVSHMRVNNDGHLYAMGGCSVETFPGELWPLPNGFQPGPAGQPSQCDSDTGPNAVNSQHLLIMAATHGSVLYGSFFGFSSSQIEPTALEVDSTSQRAFIAGHTNIGPEDTLMTTPNAFQPEPGDSACAGPHVPPCGWGDAFVIVVNPAFLGANTLEYASYFGGQGRESDVAMALDGNGLVRLVGNTLSRGTFPGLNLTADRAIFTAALDISQTGVDQLVTAATIVEGLDTSLLSPLHSGARFRLLPSGRSALLAFSDDAAFPLVDPLFSNPRDPDAPSDAKALLLVHDPSDGIVLATYLDDVSLAHKPLIAAAPDGVLYVAAQTTELGRSTDGTAPIGVDVLLFGIDDIGVAAPNSPPLAQANGDRTEVSSSPLGRRVLLYGGFSFDLDGDPLTYVWTEGSIVLGSDSLIEAFLTPGDHVITLTVDDGRGGVDTDTITVRVVPNTSAGGPQTVSPQDSAWTSSSSYLESPVTVRFTNVTAPGFTSLTTRWIVAPVPPPGMQFGSPPLHFDLATTSSFSGDIDVCIDYRGMSFARPDVPDVPDIPDIPDIDVRIYKQQSGTWVPLPQANDTAARSVCGTTAALGTFALFTPAVPANEISLIAGQPLRTTVCTRNQGLDPNEGGFATDSSLCNTRGLAHDAARNYLYFAEAGQGDSIRRLDLATNRVTTVAGTGFTTGAVDGPGGDPRDDDKNNVDPLTAPVNQVLRLALDAAGNLLLAEYGEGRIRKIDFNQNRIFTVADVSTVTHPSALVIDSSGAALFSSFGFGDYRIWRLTPGADGVLDGSPDEILQAVAGNGSQNVDVSVFPAGGIGPRLIPVPTYDLAFGPDGSLYATGWSGNATVVRISPGPDGLIDGNADTAFLVAGGLFAGPNLGDGTAASSARLFLPISIAVAQNGDVYLGDTGNPSGATVRKITAVDGVVTGAPDEIISTVAGFLIHDPAFSAGTDLPFSDGDGHALSSIFGAAFDVMVLPTGHLLVNDFFQIRRIGSLSGDSTPPVLTLPPPIVAEAQGPAGAVVTFVASAVDAVDGSVAVACLPPSESLFPFTGVGPTVTTVLCSAHDAAGNTATGSLTVTVRDTTPPALSLPASIVAFASSASGAAVTYTATASDLVSGPLAPTCAPASGATFAVGTTAVACVATDAAGNAAAGSFSVTLVPPAIVSVVEQITVTDSPGAVPPLDFSLTPPQATSPLGSSHTVTAVTSDSSDASARVVLSAITVVGPRARFTHPGVANAPLSVLTAPNSLGGVDIIVGLATNAAGALASTAAQVVAAINADPAASAVATAQLWPSSVGSGIVRPRPLRSLTPVQFSITGATTSAASCLTDVPGFCSVSYPGGTVGTDIISAYLDENGNASQEAAEPSATAQKTWTRGGPVLRLPDSITTEATGPSGAVVTFNPTATDALDGSVPVICIPASGSTFPLAIRSVTCSATNSAGLSSNGSFDVTVVDTTPPALSLPASITAFAPSASGVAVTYTATASDLVSGPLSPTCAPASGAAFALGTTAVTCTATDAAGNQATGSFSVTVVPPAIISVVEQITVTDSLGVVRALDFTLTPAAATSATGIPHTVTALASDGSDEHSRVVLAQTGAIDARTRFVNPGAANAPLSVSTTANSLGGVDITVSLSTDATGTLSSTAVQVVAALSADPSASSLVTAQLWPNSLGAGIVQPRPLRGMTAVQFSIAGATTLNASCLTDVPGFCAVSYTGNAVGTDVISAYLDANGNAIQEAAEPSATAQKSWTRGGPVLRLPESITTEATGPSGAVVTFTATASDAVDGSVPVTCTPVSGSTFPLGTRSVSCSAINSAGLSSNGSFDVTVEDTTPPALSLPADFFRFTSSTSGTAVTYTATASDLVSGPLSPVCSPASGATFALGATTVTCTATDAAGNQATGSFSVTVAPPPFPPVSLQLPGDLTTLATSASGAVVTYSATAQGGLGGGTTPRPAFCLPASGSTFPIGTTTVGCTDLSSIPFGATGSFTVTVNVGTPSLMAMIADQGSDSDGSVWIDLRLTNGGSGHARNVRFTSVQVQRLAGIGSVSFNAARSGPLPLQVGSIDAGATRIMRLYLNVPATVARFRITVGITLENVIGSPSSQSFAQAVIQ
jgi:hypothetical protein